MAEDQPNSRISLSTEELLSRYETIASMLDLHKLELSPENILAILFTAISNWPTGGLRNRENFFEAANQLIDYELACRAESGEL